jgi:hypothetical protein
MDIKRAYILHCKAFKNLPKFRFLVGKYTIWQPWSRWLRAQGYDHLGARTLFRESVFRVEYKNSFGSEQGCQIFLGTIYQNENIPNKSTYMYFTKWPQNIPNGHKIYNKWMSNRPNGHKICQHVPLQVPPKFTQIRIFGLKIYHLATSRKRNYVAGRNL